MSQIYRDMNKRGKSLFYQACAFLLFGLLLLITNYGELAALGAASIAVGVMNLSMAGYDDRCNKGYIEPAKNEVKKDELPGKAA